MPFVGGLAATSGRRQGQAPPGSSTVGVEFLPVFSLTYMLAVFLPGLAVGVRRLHDTNRSGWWILISVLPLIGPIVMLVFTVSGGTRGPNSYGPDPKGVPAHAGY